MPSSQITSLNLPDAFLSVIGLGAPEAVFPVKSKNRIGSLGGAVVFLGAGGLTVLFAFVNAYNASQRYGPAVFGKRLVGPLVFGLVLGALGLWAAWSAYANWNRMVVVYTHGLALRDRKGVRFWRWEQIEALYRSVVKRYVNGIYTGTTHIYTIGLGQSGRERFDDRYQNVEKLGDVLQGRTFGHLYAHAAEAYNAGRKVQFGRVTLDKGGITVGKKTYPWESVEGVFVRQGVLRVMKKSGGWFSGASVAVNTIPNLTVLLSLIDQIVGLNTPR